MRVLRRPVGRPWQAELGPDWPEVQTRNLHPIGNLTLIGYNSQLSDRPFAEKERTGKSMPSAKLPVPLGPEGIDVDRRWPRVAATKAEQLLAGRPDVNSDGMTNGHDHAGPGLQTGEVVDDKTPNAERGG